MAREVRQYAVTIPKGTTAAAPYKVKLAMPVRVVTKIRYQVPPGPNGVMGFAIGSAGVAVIPINGGWIVTNNSTETLPLKGYIDSGTWWVLGYNTGTYTHTVYLTFTCTLPGTVGAGPSVPPTAITTISGTTSTTPGLVPTPAPPPTVPVPTPGTPGGGTPPAPTTPTAVGPTGYRGVPYPPTGTLQYPRHGAAAQYFLTWRTIGGTVFAVFTMSGARTRREVARRLGATTATLTAWWRRIQQYNPGIREPFGKVYYPRTPPPTDAGAGSTPVAPVLPPTLVATPAPGPGSPGPTRNPGGAPVPAGAGTSGAGAAG